MEKKNDLRDGFVMLGGGQMAKVIKYACNTYYIAFKIKGEWYDFTQYGKEDFELIKNPNFEINTIINNGIYIYKQIGDIEFYLVAEPMFIQYKKPYKKDCQTLLREFYKHQNFIGKDICLNIIKEIKADKLKPNKSI